MENAVDIIRKIKELISSGADDEAAAATRARLMTELRQKIRLRPTQFAQELGVSVQTVHRWENVKIGQPPRNSHLRAIEGLFDKYKEKGFDVDQSFVEMGKRNLAIRSAKYVLSREEFASEVWIFKEHRQFFSGISERMRETMIDIVKSRTDNAEDGKIIYYFAFVTESSEAGNSWKRFRQWLKNDQMAGENKIDLDELKTVFLPALLSQEKYKDFWLVQMLLHFPIGIVIVFYTNKEHSRLGRSFDVFIELESAELMDVLRQDNIESHGCDIWIQLSESQATELKDRLIRMDKTLEEENKIALEKSWGWGEDE